MAGPTGWSASRRRLAWRQNQAHIAVACTSAKAASPMRSITGGEISNCERKAATYTATTARAKGFGASRPKAEKKRASDSIRRDRGTAQREIHPARSHGGRTYGRASVACTSL